MHPAFDRCHSLHETIPSKNNDPLKSALLTDGAIDVALRSVQLPEGLLMRLGKLLYNLPADATGPVDSLGC